MERVSQSSLEPGSGDQWFWGLTQELVPRARNSEGKDQAKMGCSKWFRIFFRMGKAIWCHAVGRGGDSIMILPALKYRLDKAPSAPLHISSTFSWSCPQDFSSWNFGLTWHCPPSSHFLKVSLSHASTSAFSLLGWLHISHSRWVEVAELWYSAGEVGHFPESLTTPLGAPYVLTLHQEGSVF